MLHLRQGSFTRKVRTIFTLKIIVSIFVNLFLKGIICQNRKFCIPITTISYDWCLNKNVFLQLINVMKCTRIGGKRCNCSCFEIDQEMDAILLMIGIVYGVCRIVIISVQQCTYFLFFVNLLLIGVITDKEPCKFAVNKRQNTNYSFLPVTS